MNARIEKISPYFIQMQVINAEGETIIYINVTFKTTWHIPDDITLKYDTEFFMKDDRTWVFYTLLSNGEKKLFDSIDYVIKTNIDAETRQELFLKKVKELETIFLDENNDLKCLTDLTFNYKQKKVKLPQKLEKTITSEINSSINQDSEKINMINCCEEEERRYGNEEDKSCQQD